MLLDLFQHLSENGWHYSMAWNGEFIIIIWNPFKEYPAGSLPDVQINASNLSDLAQKLLYALADIGVAKE